MTRSGSGGDEPTMDIDAIACVLGNQRRRYVVEYLWTVEERSATVAEIVDWIVAQEHPDGYTSKERKSVYVSLHQTHLGRLDGANVIDYDSDRGIVKPGENHQTAFLALRQLRQISGGSNRPE